MTKIKSLCIYCGSQPGTKEIFVSSALQLGRMLAKSDVRLVYGGGTKGVMGAVAKACHENGGRVLGIIPEFLLNHEALHKPELYCDELIVTDNMHDRKQKMFENADAFIALPGGIGTLEELVEIMTWAQLGRHTKPMGVLNIESFWDPLIDLLDHMQEAGFLHSAQLARPSVMNTVDDIAAMIKESA